MKKLLAIASIALLAVTACTPKPRDITPKVLWASQSDGIVHLGYKQTKFGILFNPVSPDWISALMVVMKYADTGDIQVLFI